MLELLKEKSSVSTGGNYHEREKRGLKDTVLAERRGAMVELDYTTPESQLFTFS